MKTTPEPFAVYAIRYATVARETSENFIGGDPHEAGMHMDYFVWVAISAGKSRSVFHTLRPCACCDTKL